MTNFWNFPFGVRVTVPDSLLPELESTAGMTGADWAMEYDGEAMHFRFETAVAAILIAMIYDGRTDFVLPRDDE